MEFIEKILTSNGGALGIVVALLGLAFWVVAKIAKIAANHDSFTSDVSGLKDDLKSVHVDVAYLKGSIITLLSENSPFAQRKSPVVLTEKGIQVCKRLNAEQMVANNWKEIYRKLKNDVKSKNAYDIQQFCIETASADISYFLKPDDIDKVKLDAFKGGYTLANYGGLFGIIIRDKFFELEKIHIDQIDECNPNIKK